MYRELPPSLRDEAVRRAIVDAYGRGCSVRVAAHSAGVMARVVQSTLDMVEMGAAGCLDEVDGPAVDFVMAMYKARADRATTLQEARWDAVMGLLVRDEAQDLNAGLRHAAPLYGMVDSAASEGGANAPLSPAEIRLNVVGAPPGVVKWPEVA